MPVAHARNAYQSGDLTTPSQRDLIVRLYLGAERFLGDARAAMERHEVEPAHTACQKAKAIFSELASTLNFEHGGDIAVRLRELYLFFIQRIGEANLRKEPALLVEIVPIIASLRDAWTQVPTEFADLSATDADQRGHVLDIRM